MKKTYLFFLSFSLLFVSFKVKETVQRKPAKSQRTQASKSSKPAPQIAGPSSCPASPYPITVKQADGSSITVIGKGNMANSWTETLDGYTVIKKEGIYEYATERNGKLEPSGIQARDSKNRKAEEKQFLQSVPKSLRTSALRTSAVENQHSQVLEAPQKVSFPSTGTRKTLLILIKYPDLANTYTVSNFDNLMNQSNYNGTGSFKDFYKASSFGKLDISTDVFGWYTASNNYAYYGYNKESSRATKLVREAIDAAEAAGVDFSKYDNDKDGKVDGVIIAHSGPGAEEGSDQDYVWSHRWQLSAGNNSATYDGVVLNDYIINPERRLFSSSMVGIGVFCHEFGHNLGLPDLYDTSGNSEGIGNWCLMAGGAWLGYEHSPANMSAWCKMTLGWINPTVITANGAYSLKGASANAECYRINTQLSNEYFLIENRQKTGLDISLAGSGLAIWHINTNKTSSTTNNVNADRTLKGVDLEEADGLNQLDGRSNRGDAGDLFPGTSNNKSFNDFSLPNSRTYTAANTGIGIKSISIDGSGNGSFNYEDLKTIPPTLTSFTPTSASPGNTVSITGTNFTFVNTVSFGGMAPKSFIVTSPTNINAVMSTGATGSVTVSSPAGSSTLSGFTYVPPPPAPVITAISPSFAAIDSVVTITGKDFGSSISQNAVYFGGVKANILTASSTSITVSVPKGAGYGPISVTANGLTGYSSKPFNVIFPNIESTFGVTSFEKNSISAPNSASQSKGIVYADFNNDGLLDLAATRGYDSYISIYKNNGDSKQPFTSTPQVISSNYGAQNLAVADFDGDGKLDLISCSSSIISIQKNISTASTIAFSRTDIYASVPGDITIADFDGDGRPDLAHVSGNLIYVRRNTSENGTFSFSDIINLTAGAYPIGIFASDLNGDGKPEICVANSASNTISVFKNISEINLPSFSTKIDFSTGSSPTDVVAGDFNSDGLTDLAVAYTIGNTVSILKNTSTGPDIAFASKADFTIGGNSNAVKTADFNGDGKPDLLVSNGSLASVSLLGNTSSGSSISFASKADYTTGGNITSLTVADWNSDGKPDITTHSSSNSLYSFLRNQVSEPTLSAYEIVAQDAAHNVLLTGTNLSSAKSVSVAGSAAKSFTLVSETTIKALVKEGIFGTLSVTTPYGTASLQNFSNVPVPAISSFSPKSGIIGSSVTIKGSNFDSVATNNIVYFGAVRASVTSGNKDSLVVKVPAGATYSPISVTAKGLTANASKQFNLTFAGLGSSFSSTTFSARKDVSISSFSPRGVASADFNNDGKADIAIANTYYYAINIFKNGNSGTSADVSLSLNYSPKNINVSDIDGDGLLDISVIYSSGTPVSIFRNTSTNGTISFATKVDISIASTPYDFTFADFDRDGKPDLSITNYYSSSVSIFKNLSSPGTISFSAKTDFTTGSYPNTIQAADVDGDNKLDLVVTNSNANSLSILKNKGLSGQISFADKLDYSTGYTASGLQIADLDGDDKLDLAICHNGVNYISIFRNTSSLNDVSFAPKADFIANSNAQNISTADIDGDGKTDLAVINGNYISLYKNTSTKSVVSLASKVDYATGSSPFGVAITDWTGDGKPDMAISNYSSSSYSIFTNTVNEPSLSAYTLTNTNSSYNTTLTGGNLTGASSVTVGGTAVTSYTVTSESTITAMVPARISGIIEVVTPFGSATLAGYSNIPPPAISSISPMAATVGSTVVVKGSNFNSTAANNLVYFGSVKASITAATDTTLSVKVPAGATYAPIKVTSNYLTAFSAKNFNVTFPGGNAVFTPSSFAPKSDINSSSSYGYTPYDVSSADFDGDGKLDLAVLTSYYLYIYKNTGSASVPIPSSPSLTLSFGGSLRALTTADLDGDGLLDIALTNTSSNAISILRNTSTGNTLSFATKIDYVSGSSPYDIAAGDLDLDGKLDLAIANNYGYTVSILRNTGSLGIISFASKVDLQAGSYSSPSGICITDLDLDGKSDIAITNNSSSSISVFRNISTSSQLSFASRSDFSVGSSPTGITVADFDQDGKNDLAIANNGASSVTVLKNISSTGAVSFSTKLDFSVANYPQGIIADDFNGDGKPDLAINSGSNNFISILANSGNNTVAFNTKTEYAIGSGSNSIVGADLSGDGKPDIATVNNVYNSSYLKNQVTEPTLVSYRINAGSTAANVTLTGTNLGSATALTFAGKAPTSYTVLSATSITALVPENTTGTVTVTTPYGTASINGFSNIPAPIISSFSPESGNSGTSVTISGANFALTTEGNTVYFGAVKATVTAATSTSLTVTVPAGASYKPITITANNLTAYSAKPFGVTFSYDNPLFPNNAFAKPAAISSSSYSPRGTIVTDLDGDGKADLIVSNEYYLYIYKNNGSATAPYSSSASLSLSLGNGYVQNVSFGDIDGDGKQDILLSTSANVVSIFRNTSSGSSLSFASKVDIPTSSNPQGITLADVDLDGRTDVLTANSGSGTVSVIFNQSYSGNILFASKTDYLVGSSPTKVAVADFDADGYPDIAVANHYSNSVSVLLNTKADGVFKTKTDFATGSYPMGLATGDINADGKPDLVIANYSSNTISVLKNTSSTGSASFAAKTDFSTGSYPGNVIISDLNGDGLADIGVTNTGSSSISIFKNNSTSSAISLSTKADYNISSPLDIVINDLNGDSKPDIAVPSSYSSTYFLRNTVTSAPLITSFTPTNACTSSPITITGVNFTGVTSVNIGSYAAASYTVNSSTSITATPNSYVSGLNSITITNAEGSNTISGLTIQSTPVIYYSGYKTIKKGGYAELSCSSYYSSYQWYKNGVAISGATSYYYPATQSGSYTVSTGACQSLPVAIAVVGPTDIKALAVSATCKGRNNGRINIKATYPASYLAYVTVGLAIYEPTSFSSELDLPNMLPGTYTIRVAIAESGATIGTYTLQVTEPKDLSVYSSIDQNNENVDLILDGASKYIIRFNGQTINTSENAISLKLAKGENKLSVSTDIACQGVYERTFVISNEVLVYPNPFDQILHIGLGANALSEAEVKVYTLDGKLAHSKTYESVNGLISPELSGLNPGTYILRLTSGNSSTIHRIVKK